MKGSVENNDRRVSFKEAFSYWLKLGCISFGGPAGQIALMHKELVERRRWLSEERFLQALNYCMLLPGPEAQQLAVYIGWLMHRTVGGIVAGAFFVIPSIFVLLVMSYIYAAYGHLPSVEGVLSGFKHVVVAIVVEALLKIGGRALKGSAHLVIAATSFVAIYFLHVPFPLIVLIAAIVGLVGAKLLPDSFKASAAKTKAAVRKSSTTDADLLPTVIDDNAAPLPHTQPSTIRVFKVLAVGVALWLLPFVGLVAWRGFDSLHVKEYTFFSQAALVTFGGAYAVLAYVSQAAPQFGWITQVQAVDGLALAETTPGPLIIVLQFVGFMAAWNNADGMNQTASGIVGALITTWTTFLPSFIFIFLGAPYIEALRGNKNLAGALSGITAAVVGVILNLAIVFGVAVVLPDGSLTSINWFALAMTAAAFFALYRLKIDVLWVVLTGGAIGLAKTFLFQ